MKGLVGSEGDLFFLCRVMDEESKKKHNILILLDYLDDHDYDRLRKRFETCYQGVPEHRALPYDLDAVEEPKLENPYKLYLLLPICKTSFIDCRAKWPCSMEIKTIGPYNYPLSLWGSWGGKTVCCI